VAPAPAADRTYRLLEGRFDSVDQARSSPGVGALQVTACPAEAVGLGPRALYVEWTQLARPDTPERQRVVVVEPGEPAEETAISRVFELADPGAAAGACGRKSPPRFRRDELVERVGCAMSLHADGTVFRGSTSGRGCPSSRDGATYATHELVLDALGFRTLDRGYDPTGAPRWGAAAGPVIFVRRTPLGTP